MPPVRVNWQQLKGRQLETTTGASFTVVRVTATHVTIRPQRGSRNYALSIPGELERGMAVYAGGPVFPTPAELRLSGVRPILTSYAWGVLKAVLVDEIGLQAIRKVALKDFASLWHFTEMPDMDEAYLKAGLGSPSLQLHAPASKRLWGQYQIGLSVGNLQGDLREFGGEHVVVFGYAGMDEMEPVSGSGWMRSSTPTHWRVNSWKTWGVLPPDGRKRRANSANDHGDILANPYGLPAAPRWQNYWNLLFDPRIRFYRYFYNSPFVTFFGLCLVGALATLAGYGFGRPRYQFRFRGWLFALLLFGLVLPPQIMYIPQFTMMARYGLLNTRWALVLLYAARIDGCSDFRMFWQIMLPLARPALATVLLVNSLTFWNELLLSVTMVTSPERRTLPAAMFNFVGENASGYAMAATNLVAAMLPLLILYLILSERFIEGMTAGALNG